MPARLSAPNDEMREQTCAMSSCDDRRIGKIREVVFEARLGRPPEIEHDFDDIFEVVEPDERLPNREGEDVEELGEFPTRGDGMDSTANTDPAFPEPSPRCVIRPM